MALTEATCKLCAGSLAELGLSKRKGVCQPCAKQRQNDYQATCNTKLQAVQERGLQEAKRAKTSYQKPCSLGQAREMGLLEEATEVPTPRLPVDYNRNAAGEQKAQTHCNCGAVKGVARWARYVDGAPTGKVCHQCGVQRDNERRQERKKAERNLVAEKVADMHA